VAAEAGVADRTAIRSYVPDEVLASLYAGAGVFVFLSDYEGFGLTPLEALAAGVPILVGDTPVAREIYGDAAAFVRTGEVDRIAEQIDRLLCDAPARAALLAHAPAVLARYSWDRAGQETLQALVEAARA
jgi:glycosyltransferase involved in cell wall biosynthesis